MGKRSAAEDDGGQMRLEESEGAGEDVEGGLKQISTSKSSSRDP
jgi:hypothetical protein